MVWLRIVGLAFVFALVVACGDSDKPSGPVDSYVALVPRVLRSGETETVSLTLFNGSRMADSSVQVTVGRDGETIASGSAQVSGKGTIELPIPPDASGEYEVTVAGQGFKDRATVQVQDGTLLFLESDKPIYKPGQIVQMRLVSLNSELTPLPTSATIEIMDAKGNKIFKRVVETDEFGMASLDLPLSFEPNLGVWKITAAAGDVSTEIDVRVEEYVLPKYEIAIEMVKPWFLANERLTGSITATYSFGKPVNGTLEIEASRYVGEWQQYTSTLVDVVDGKADFDLAAAEYVAGVAEAGGNGNVQLDFTVTERNTGYEERTSELVTVASAPVTLQLIAETPAFKPTLPLKVLLISETPDGQPVESTVNVEVYYTGENFEMVDQETQRVETTRGVGTLTLLPPEDATNLSISAYVGDAYTYKEIGAAYSPSGNFIHVSQLTPTDLSIGSTAQFHVDSTSEARTFYYEVVSRDRVVFTSASDSPSFDFEVTPAMTGANKLLVYQVLPNSEVAADFIPFEVEAAYPQELTATFGSEESRPGDALEVAVQAQGRSKVGVVAVDRSVFILAENRMNLQQVFDEIERLYQQPQAELHEDEFFAGPIVIPGAEDTFANAGVLVMTDKRVPEGKKIESPALRMFQGDMALAGVPQADGGDEEADRFAESPGILDYANRSAGLAEVQRVRQFFPETWIWEEAVTDDDGRITLPVEAPDTITTWELRAVAVSPEFGLGVAEAELRVFQEFFLSADLPYSATRGEEFPLKVSLYNYTDSEQEFQVEIEDTEWFDLLDDATKTVTIAANDTGGAEFLIRPTGVGTQTVKVTARSSDSADAVIKSMIVEPEGVQREQLVNGVLNDGGLRDIAFDVPLDTVPDSARAQVAITGSLLAQTIQGLDQLLAMPYGCGEQNMLLFAPDTYILKYLKGTNQLKPEIRAKAETLLITGYQRELTYRRTDGSFSAFGNDDQDGSLFLTAFVLKTFAQAKDLIYVDEAVLADAATWITSHQNADGSFQDVGFVHHSELLGGVSGRDALTAYAAIAMIEAGQTSSAERAIGYLEDSLEQVEDAYALALVAYALELGDSALAGEAYDKLMAAAEEDEDGLHWPGVRGGGPIPIEGDEGFAPYPGQVSGSSDIEATAYATLALTEHGDSFNAGRAAKWLTAHKNSLGGFGSTQDTVVALQALTQYAANAGSDTEMTVTVRAGDEVKTIEITPQNFDVLQIVDVPSGVPIAIEASGRGQAVYQAVSRYNVAEAEEADGVFDITVDFDTTQVEVNDTVRVDVSVAFDPPVFEPLPGGQGDIAPVLAGMVVLDVAIPTGFAPVTETLESLVASDPKVKRFDVAGRKVILYIDDMAPGDEYQFTFDVVAQYPVKAKGGASAAYSYYKPEWRGETVGEAVTVGE